MEGEEGGNKIYEVETDWVTVKRRTEQRRQQARDEASAREVRWKRVQNDQMFVKVDGFKVFALEVSLRRQRQDKSRPRGDDEGKLNETCTKGKGKGNGGKGEHTEAKENMEGKVRSKR